MRYFLHIKYIAPEANHAFVAGKCIACLHGFMSLSKITTASIGVTFPSWSTDAIGNSIAFVSKDINALSYISSVQYLKNMANEGFVEVSDIELVPTEAEEVRFIRNQHVAKSFPAEVKRRLIRAKKRAEQRGEPFMPSDIVSNRIVDHYHVIPMDSRSSGQRFALYVQRATLDGKSGQGSYNSYGLATHHKHCASVPSLQQIT
ncbi:type I-F CRISPR-associated endoribonuclease Cas6/Csy4 [Halomonas sp. CH40]